MKIATTAQGVNHRHCGYILYTGKPRGCEPGMGCSRYDNGKKAEPAVRPIIGPPRWAAPARELWEDGISKAEIARRLGITWSQVDYRAKMHWEKGED
jgi:hypothetical protein